MIRPSLDEMTADQPQAHNESSYIDYGRTRTNRSQLRRQWVPAGEPRAAALIVHGLAEHSGRYEQVGSALARAGISTVAYDQRGHGETEGRRGHVESFSEFLDDVADHLAELSMTGLPIALIGHSMGGLIACAYAIQVQTNGAELDSEDGHDGSLTAPDKLVLSAPALGTAVPSWQQMVVSKLAQLAPSIFLPARFDSSILTSDPQCCREYDRDPLIRPGGTAQLLDQMFKTAASLTTRLDLLRVETLCVHGDADELVPTAASEPLDRVESVTRRTYPGLRHEVFNEPQGQAIVKEVIDFVINR